MPMSSHSCTQIRLGSFFQKNVPRIIWTNEIFVSDSINELVHCNPSGNGLMPTHNFLQWYVAEQIEEEALAP